MFSLSFEQVPRTHAALPRWRATLSLCTRNSVERGSQGRPSQGRSDGGGGGISVYIPPQNQAKYGVTMTSARITYCETQWVLKFYTSPKQISGYAPGSKSVEIIFTTKRKRQFTPPPLLPGITRVATLKVLGVTISDKPSVSAHVQNSISSCAQPVHAVRTLHAHGICQEATRTVFQSVVVTK